MLRAVKRMSKKQINSAKKQLKTAKKKKLFPVKLIIHNYRLNVDLT